MAELILHYALCLSYDGTDYKGWQAQVTPGINTLQETLETALSKVANETIKVVGAGRTDAGVHATGQIVSFRTQAQRELKAWVRGTNANLPTGLVVNWLKEVPQTFHARFSALSRRYIYCIHNHEIRQPLLHGKVKHHRHPLDETAMQLAGKYLHGEHDFSAFRASGCQSSTPMRCVHALDVIRVGQYLVVDITANAFLLHMVRNIVGALIVIGEGKEAPEWLAWLLKSRDRKLAPPTAPAHGLTLFAVAYPSVFELPTNAEYFLPILK